MIARLTRSRPRWLVRAAGLQLRVSGSCVVLVGGVRQKGHEVLVVRAAPAGDRVPAGSGLVAGEEAGWPEHRVVAGDHVVEGAVVGGAAGNGVDGRVDEAEVVAGVLVGQGDHGRP